MGKTLIGCDCVEQHICQENSTIYLNKSMILTCGAKDHLRNKGISIVYGEKPAPPAILPETEPPLSPSLPGETSAPCMDADQAKMEKIMETVLTILKNEHEITDTETLKNLSLKILKQLKFKLN